jgi:AcrR family transcriptional regulator
MIGTGLQYLTMNESSTTSDGRSKKRPGIAEQNNSIVKAAVALFCEHGTAAVSISQICQQADITRPTFYRCFKDKDALLEELYRSSVNRAVEDILLHHIDKPGKGLDWIRTSLEGVYDAIFEQAELADLLFREAGDPSSPAYAIVNAAFDDIAKKLLHLAGITSNKSAAIIYFKSIMAANQWIVHDAITKGLTPKSRREAKNACWMMVGRLFPHGELKV